jgi:hypothetical protein
MKLESEERDSTFVFHYSIQPPIWEMLPFLVFPHTHPLRKHPHRHTWKYDTPILQAFLSPVKLTPRTNHHTLLLSWKGIGYLEVSLNSHRPGDELAELISSPCLVNNLKPQHGV